MNKVPKHPCRNCICKPSCRSNLEPGAISDLMDCKLFNDYLILFRYERAIIKTYYIFKMNKYIDSHANPLLRGASRKWTKT